MPSRFRLPSTPLRVLARYRYRAAAAGILLLLVGLALSRPEVRELPARHHLLPEPPGLTELSFARASTLPSEYTPYRRQAVAFRVRNLEHREMDYPYQAYLESQSGRHLIGAGTLRIAPDDSITKDQEYIVNAYTGRVRVVIHLPSQNQSIHLWLEPK